MHVACLMNIYFFIIKRLLKLYHSEIYEFMLWFDIGYTLKSTCHKQAMVVYKKHNSTAEKM